MSALQPYYSLRNDGSRILRNGAGSPSGAILRNEQVLDYTPPLCVCIELSPELTLALDLLPEFSIVSALVPVSYQVHINQLIPELTGTGELHAELVALAGLREPTKITGYMQSELAGILSLDREQSLSGRLLGIHYVALCLLPEWTIQINLRPQVTIAAELKKCQCP